MKRDLNLLIHEIEYEYDCANLERILKIVTWHADIVPVKLLIRNREEPGEERRLWERDSSDWFEIQKSYFSDLVLVVRSKAL